MQTKICLAVTILLILVIGGIYGAPADTTDTCPTDQPRVYCFQNPCNNLKCPQVPGAKCYPYYCGSCNYIWLTQDGQLAKKCYNNC